MLQTLTFSIDGSEDSAGDVAFLNSVGSLHRFYDQLVVFRRVGFGIVGHFADGYYIEGAVEVAASTAVKPGIAPCSEAAGIGLTPANDDNAASVVIRPRCGFADLDQFIELALIGNQAFVEVQHVFGEPATSARATVNDNSSLWARQLETPRI